MAASSSALRMVSLAGSKVLTDPGKLGPELLELLVERESLFLGHRAMVAVARLTLAACRASASLPRSLSSPLQPRRSCRFPAGTQERTTPLSGRSSTGR